MTLSLLNLPKDLLKLIPSLDLYDNDSRISIFKPNLFNTYNSPVYKI